MKIAESDQGELDEFVIVLNKPGWFGDLRNQKYSKIKQFTILGPARDIGNSKLYNTDLIGLIQEAIRLRCDVFLFRHVDFILFRDILYGYSLPIKTIELEVCDNIEMFIPQIFNVETNACYNRQYRVDNLAFNFYSGPDNFIRLKSRIERALQYNYQFRLIRYPTVAVNLTESQSEKSGELNRDINKLLRRNLAIKSISRDSILTLLLIRRFRNGTLLNLLPRDVVLILVKILLGIINEYKHILGASGKIDGIMVESTYNKLKAPRGHQEILNISYGVQSYEQLKPWRELKRNGITLNKLVLVPLAENVSNFGGTRMSNVFNLLINTNVRILEIHGMDFDDMSWEGINGAREQLTGDDSRISGIMTCEYPEPSLTNIHLVKCKNIPLFISYFIKVMNKEDKPCKYPKDRRYTYNYEVDTVLKSLSTNTLSIFVDRESNIIHFGNTTNTQ